MTAVKIYSQNTNIALASRVFRTVKRICNVHGRDRQKRVRYRRVLV